MPRRHAVWMYTYKSSLINNSLNKYSGDVCPFWRRRRVKAAVNQSTEPHHSDHTIWHYSQALFMRFFIFWRLCVWCVWCVLISTHRPKRIGGIKFYIHETVNFEIKILGNFVKLAYLYIYIYKKINKW